MPNWRRRDVLKTGLAAGVSLVLPRRVQAVADAGESLAANRGELVALPRERLRFDLGWRFRLGPDVDPAFGFEPSGGGSYAKAGGLFAPSARDFDDSSWRA